MVMSASIRPPLFKGSYRQKKIVRIAPDAFIRINGKINLHNCSKCNRQFNINPYVSSISVDLNIESTPGSANISLAIPRMDINNFYADGKFLIQEMMEIEIFAKGYFNIYGVPRYYPIFWGLVTQVSQSYSSGEHTVALSCADILKWWEKTRINVQPSYYEAAMTQGGELALIGNVFAGANPFDIIFALSRNVSGDLFLGQRSLQSTDPDFFSATGQVVVTQIMQYWQQRFKRVRNSLVLYGMDGSNIGIEGLHSAADALEQQMRVPGAMKSPELMNSYNHLASDAILSSMTKGGTNFLNPTDPGIVAYKNMFTQAGQINLWESEYLSRIEIANVCKDVIGYEFYMDSTGDIVFKPPFWNLDVRANKPISWIRDIDIIDENYTSSESEVYTTLTLNGAFNSKSEYGIEKQILPSSAVTDYKLLAQYGIRSSDVNVEWCTSPKGLFFHGLDLLDRMNARRTTGSITIPFRPELRMGFPIYVESRDEFWYVVGVSHTISFGSRATTTVTLQQRRGKFVCPRDYAKSASPVDGYENTTDGQQSLDTVKAETKRDPVTNKILGDRNIILVYNASGTEELTSNDISASSTPAKGLSSAAQKKKDGTMTAQAFTNMKAIINKANTTELDDSLSNIFKYGNPGLASYIYAQSNDKVLSAGSVTIDAAKGGRDTSGKQTTSNKKKETFKLIFPVSDEYGYDHIGNYRYGRGLVLSGGGIREVSGGVTLGQADSTTITSKLSATIQSQGLESLASMKPRDESDVSYEPNSDQMGTQKVTTYNISDPYAVEVDSTARGTVLSNLLPVQESGQQSACSCMASRMNLDILSLLAERVGTSDTNNYWLSRRSDLENSNGLATLFSELLGRDFSSSALADHMNYEKLLRTGEK